jgi:hypothetical protein
VVLSIRIFRLQWVGTSHWFSYKWGYALQVKMMSTVIPLYTSDQFMSLWLYQNHKLILFFSLLANFCLWAFSQQTSACTWCLFLAVLGLWESHSVPAPCQVCPEVVWLRCHCITVIYCRSLPPPPPLLSYVRLGRDFWPLEATEMSNVESNGMRTFGYWAVFERTKLEYATECSTAPKQFRLGCVCHDIALFYTNLEAAKSLIL